MSGEGYQGLDRRAQRVEPVSRDEFCEFRSRLDRRMDEQDAKLEIGTAVMSRLETAMFAKDEQNEFESPGVMTVMQKINRHVDMMCNVAAGVRRMGQFLMWAGGVTAAMVGMGAAAKAIGLF